MDVTSGTVGHLLFMGRGPVCQKVCVRESICTLSKNLAVKLDLVYASYNHVWMQECYFLRGLKLVGNECMCV